MPLCYSVDSINLGLARLIFEDTGARKVVNQNLLPASAKEGDLIVWDGRNYSLHPRQTRKLRQQNKRQLDMLFASNRTG